MSHYLPVVATLVTMLVATFLMFGKNLLKAPQSGSVERNLEASSSVFTSRTGGIAVISGIVSSWGLVYRDIYWWIVVPLLAVSTFALRYETRGLPRQNLLFVQAVAALIFLLGSGVAIHSPLAVPIFVLAIVWMSDVYKFMDGTDGLCGGMTFIGFSTYGLAALMGGEESFAMLNFSVAAAALGFLYFNYPPAKILMGGAGSIPLGFLASIMGIVGWQHLLWPLWFPILVFAPLLADASVTQLLGKLHKKSDKEGQREHGYHYQRLITMGWSHRDVAVAGYFLMVGASISSIAAIRYLWPGLVFLFWGLVYLLLMLLVNYRWRSFMEGIHD